MNICWCHDQSWEFTARLEKVFNDVYNLKDSSEMKETAIVYKLWSEKACKKP